MEKIAKDTKKNNYISFFFLYYSGHGIFTELKTYGLTGVGLEGQLQISERIPI
jgi:hypothetical protein